MNRREFLAGCGAAAGWLTALDGPSALARNAAASEPSVRLRFAPHAGMFRRHAGDDLLDQIRFASDCGFSGFEDARLASRPRDVQRAIGRRLARSGLDAGTILATADFRRATFASGSREASERVLADVRHAADVARLIGGRSCCVMPGRADPFLPRREQLERAAGLLSRCVDVCEPAGVTLLVEPIDVATDARRLLVQTLDEAAALCSAVGHPGCRAVCDVYALGMAGGRPRPTCDVLAALEQSWDRIGSMQIGDAPGRKEPGTGTLDFPAIFAFLRRRGYAGLIGMDHGNSRPGLEGECHVLTAYRKAGLACRA